MQVVMNKYFSLKLWTKILRISFLSFSRKTHL